MYQVTITFEGNVLLQDIYNKEKAKSLYKLVQSNMDGWNINILRLKVDETFNLKEEFLW